MLAVTIQRVRSVVGLRNTLFALPFAFSAVLLGARYGTITLTRLGLITVCVAVARIAGVAFNRLVDAPFDAMNPRTREREVASGALSGGIVVGLVVSSCVAFVVAAAALGRVPLVLSPVALAGVLGYSYVKRFSSLCHLVLGVVMGTAPIGAWIAVDAGLHVAPVLLALAVMLWAGGFDILYALQDLGFDREAGLYSIPARLGRAGAVNVSRVLHVGMVACLIMVGWTLERGAPYYVGCLAVCALLVYEHRLARSDDSAHLRKAFFDANAYISVAYLVAVAVDFARERNFLRL